MGEEGECGFNKPTLYKQPSRPFCGSLVHYNQKIHSHTQQSLYSTPRYVGKDEDEISQQYKAQMLIQKVLDDIHVLHWDPRQGRRKEI